MDRKEALKNRLRQLANVEFPAAAREGAYPIRFNHCFLRVVYDNLLGAKWQTVLTEKKPAIHQFSEEQLAGAVDLGERIVADAGLCRELNDRSLALRGKGKDGRMKGVKD